MLNALSTFHHVPDLAFLRHPTDGVIPCRGMLILNSIETYLKHPATSLVLALRVPALLYMFCDNTIHSE